MTKYHRLGAYKQYTLLKVLKAGNLRLGYQYGPILVRALFWVANCQHLLCPYMAKTKLESSLSPFYKGINPFNEDLPLWPNYLPKSTYPSTITLGIRVSTWTFGKNIQSITILSFNSHNNPFRILSLLYNQEKDSCWGLEGGRNKVLLLNWV
jgi:hypothetical protein